MPQEAFPFHDQGRLGGQDATILGGQGRGRTGRAAGLSAAPLGVCSDAPAGGGTDNASGVKLRVQGAAARGR
ncbi:hypothetical protein GCM10027072_74510 [Streptomyces bullii]